MQKDEFNSHTVLMKIFSNNKKAYYNYFIEDTYEAGIVLKGTEIKSLRNHTCSLSEALCKVIHNEAYILNMNIASYAFGNIWNEDPLRTRKLLLHKKEIQKINDKLVLKGYTLIPLKVYIVHGLAKVEIGLAKGKKLWNKKEELKRKDINKQINQTIKRRI